MKLKYCVSDGILRIGYHEGVQGVWAGTIPSLILVSQPTLKFTIYEFLKRHYLQAYGNIFKLMLQIVLICTP